MPSSLEKLARAVENALKNKNARLVTAESCTGGGLAYELTALPGCSTWFERGFITYSNASKIELLDVKAQTLEKYGAVSAETAGEMAEGALKKSDASVSIAVTGIAGPAGGTETKPVGTIWIAIAGTALKTTTQRLTLAGDRQAIRLQTISRCFAYLIEKLSG